jgi:hypothetical protein
MPIAFACQCGKRFTVADGMAGKKAKCPECSATITVPAPAASKSATPSPTATASAPKTASPKTAAPVSSTKTAASQFHRAPLSLGPTFGQMWKTFPTHPMVSILLLLLGLAGCAGFAIGQPILGAVGIVLAIVGAVGLATFTSGAKAKFAKSQFVPGMIVSVNPPLVAMGLNLANKPGEGPWDALLVAPQDCAMRMAGPPAVGAKVAMAVVHDVPGGANHASPRATLLIDQYNGNKDAIAKLLETTPESCWTALQEAVELIGPGFTPGIFTVASHNRSGDPVPVTEVKRLMQEYLPNGPDEHRYHAGKTLVAPVLKPALTEYGSGVPAEAVLGMVKVDSDNSGKRGFLITNDGLRFKLSDKLLSDMAWSDIHTALLVDGQLEILMTSSIRMTIPTKSFEKNAHRIEKFLHAVGQLP